MPYLLCSVDQARSLASALSELAASSRAACRSGDLAVSVDGLFAERSELDRLVVELRADPPRLPNDVHLEHTVMCVSALLVWGAVLRSEGRLAWFFEARALDLWASLEALVDRPGRTAATAEALGVELVWERQPVVA